MVVFEWSLRWTPRKWDGHAVLPSCQHATRCDVQLPHHDRDMSPQKQGASAWGWIREWAQLLSSPWSNTARLFPIEVSAEAKTFLTQVTTCSRHHEARDSEVHKFYLSNLGHLLGAAPSKKINHVYERFGSLRPSVG